MWGSTSSSCPRRPVLLPAPPSQKKVQGPRENHINREDSTFLSTRRRIFWIRPTFFLQGTAPVLEPLEGKLRAPLEAEKARPLHTKGQNSFYPANGERRETEMRQVAMGLEIWANKYHMDTVTRAPLPLLSLSTYTRQQHSLSFAFFSTPSSGGFFMLNSNLGCARDAFSGSYLSTRLIPNPPPNPNPPHEQSKGSRW